MKKIIIYAILIANSYNNCMEPKKPSLSKLLYENDIDRVKKIICEQSDRFNKDRMVQKQLIDQQEPLDGQRPLHIAVSKNLKDIVALLLENGASVNSKNFIQLTPLDLAAIFGHKEIALLLLEHGASTEAPSPYLPSPSARAKYSGHSKLEKLLKDWNYSSKYRNYLISHGSVIEKALSTDAIKKQAEEYRRLLRKATCLICNTHIKESQVQETKCCTKFICPKDYRMLVAGKITCPTCDKNK